MPTRPRTRTERIRQGSRQRREGAREDLRARILTTATKMLAMGGYETFSLRKLAERIGYSATTIYLHFEDKDALVFAVLDEAMDRFGRALKEAFDSSDDAGERLRRIGRAYVKFGLENPSRYQLMFQRPEYLTRRRPGRAKPPIDAFGILLQAVDLAIAAGVLEGSRDVLADSLWAITHGIVGLGLLPEATPERIEALGNLAPSALVRGLGPVR
jgi:AcrR family transcriptional regulator